MTKQLSKSVQKFLLLLSILFLFTAWMSGTAIAKSAYVVADHHTRAFDAWNINPGGTVTFQTSQTLTSETRDPAGLAVYEGKDSSNNDVNLLFITTEFNDTIEIWDPVTMTWVTTIHTGCPMNLSAGIAVCPRLNLVFAVARNTNTLLVFDFDPDTLAFTCYPGAPFALPNTVGAWGIALDHTTCTLYVADSISGVIRGYDVSDLASGIPEIWAYSPTQVPVGIAVDTKRQQLYSTAPDSGCAYAPTGQNKLLKIDIATKAETSVALGHGGMGVAVNEDTGDVYVTLGCSGDSISVYTSDLAIKIQETAPIGNPAGIAIGKVAFNPLNLTKDDGLGEDECVATGREITYDICYDNLANVFDVTDVIITDTLPVEAIFVSADNGGIYFNDVAHTVTWDIGTLVAGAPQACVQLVVQVTASPESDILNQVTIVSDETQPTTVEEETEVCPTIPVNIDIKPASCPNPLNVGKKGVLPVAILGTDDFDVTMIDPPTVRLAGAAPIRWAMEDVATPYEEDLEGCDNCHELMWDGYIDLTLKFVAQEVVAALGEVEDGECLKLELTGNLKEEFGGTPIAGQDVMVILKK